MPTVNADKAQSSPFSRNFQDAVTLIEYEGRPVVVAREFGAFLGYAEGGRKLVDLIMGDWFDEFLPDIDSILLKNGRLAEFKRICGELGLKLVDKRAPSLLLLTKSGMELVLARTEKPQGKTFRRWLVSEAIPGYEAARAGKALPGGVSTAPQIEGPATPPPPPPPPQRPGRPGRALLLPDHEQAELSLSTVLRVDPRERVLADLDEGRLTGPPSLLGFRIFTIRDHLIGRARMALRAVHGPVWDRFVRQLVDELARIAGRPVPAFAGEPTATEVERAHLLLGRALRLLDYLEDGQLARVIPMIAAREQQARLIEWVGLAGALKPMGLAL